jgi:ferredoxin-NADP reductase
VLIVKDRRQVERGNSMEHVISARIAQLQVIDPGEIRRVQLALPDYVEIGGTRYTLHDTMRPGTAFLAKPWGTRTDKYRRRMYTRSNSSSNEPGLLETFINHTHRPQADTSIWWQTDVADHWYETGKALDIRVTVDESRGVATVYENTTVCKESNLRLEPDGDWESQRFVCVAFGTGITPFLSYVRYMAHHDWKQRGGEHHGHMTLIASVRHEGQLMLHQELLRMEHQFPEHFCYVPVLTRSWPSEWPSLKGRIMRLKTVSSGEEHVDLTPLLEYVPDLSQSDLRMCGSVAACRQLMQGLREQNICPRTIRTESW